MKVLMVCLGNICRSPMAEGILKQKCKEAGLNWEIDSAGTSGWHSGQMADERSIETCEEYDIDIHDHRARQLTKSDLVHYDLIFAMDKMNYKNILDLCSSEEQSSKVKLILNESLPDCNRDVPDPYYDFISGFRTVYNLLDDATNAILGKYKNAI